MTQVEYIESTGSQYINTGLFATDIDSAELELMLTATPAKWGCPIGSQGIYSSGAESFLLTWNNSRLNYRCGTGSNQIAALAATNINQKYKMTVNKTTKFYIDDVLQGSGSAGTLSASYTVYLFANNSQGTIRQAVSMRLYSCKMYDANNDLLLDLIPVLDDDSVACLYDNVSQSYFYNAGSGTFTAGDPIITGYTVQYNANGGSGTMADQSITSGVATPLTANTFTKDGCRFDGWALTSDGAVTYTDAQIVTDIATAGTTITLYAVWTVTDYSIVFHANGGTGSMSDQYVTVGSFPALSANTYTRDGYTFKGWSYTASGTVVFIDGETIPFDLGDAGDVIDLYAVWDKIPIQGTLYTNNSPKNKLEKDLTTLATVNIIFKDTTNIIDPIFMFSGVSTDVIAACNYIYVADLSRYYFVNKIETLRAGVWLLYCHVDVLTSYADEVKTQKAIVKRQETNNNLYINDGVFKVYQYSNIETFPFSSGFNTIQYVLMVAGN